VGTVVEISGVMRWRVPFEVGAVCKSIACWSGAHTL
jgi:hypothetical protein